MSLVPAEQKQGRTHNQARRSKDGPSGRVLLQRPRLIELTIDRALNHRAFVIIAPAGYGKTTLIEQALSTVAQGGFRPLTTCLLTIESSMSDLELFARGVVRALQQRQAQFGERTLSAIRQDCKNEVVAFSLLEDLRTFPEPILIALDDFHLVQGPTGAVDEYGVVDAVQTMLLEPRLDHVHFILATRTAPRFQHLALLRARQEVEAIDESQLAFTADEVRSYLEQVRGGVVTLAEAERVLQATAGWAVSLVLSELTAFGHPLNGPAGFRSYIEQEVLPSFPNDLRKFAIDASTLDLIDVGLANYALDRVNSAGLVRELEDRHFVQPIAASHPLRWRFHALFGEYLRSCLPAERQAEINRRCGQYWLTQQEWVAAAEALARAEEWPRLCEILTRHGRNLLDEGYGKVLRTVLERAREGLRRSDRELPDELLVLLAETLFRVPDVAAITDILAAVHISSDGPIGTEAAILRARLYKHVGRTIEAAECAEAELTRRRCTVRQEAALEWIAGSSYLYLGDHAAGERHSLQAMDRFQALGLRSEAALVKQELGVLAWQRADYVQAERLFREAIRSFNQSRPRRIDELPMALNSLATTIMVNGFRYAEAMETLGEALQLVEASGDLNSKGAIYHTLGEAAHGLGQHELAAEYFRASADAAGQRHGAYCQLSALLWGAIEAIELRDYATAEALSALVRQHKEANSYVRILLLEQVSRFRFAWKLEDFKAAADQARKLAAEGERTRQHRFLLIGRLGLLGSLQHTGLAQGNRELDDLAKVVLDAREYEDAARLFPDVGEAALQALSTYPNHPMVRSRRFRDLLDRARLSRENHSQVRPNPVLPAPPERPRRIEVYALRETLQVFIDGKLMAKRWGKALNLFLYFVHFGGGTGIEIASRLWERDEPFSDRPGGRSTDERYQVRFQSTLWALRHLLHRDVIVYEGSRRLGRYVLNPDIELAYDVRKFLTLAGEILKSPVDPAQWGAIQVVKDMRRARFWLAEHHSKEQGRRRPMDPEDDWAQELAGEIDDVYYQILDREIQVAESANIGQATLAALKDARAKFSIATGAGLRALSFD